MYSNIKQLRRNGVPLNERDIGPGVFGEVSVVWWNGQKRLVIMPGDGLGTQGKKLPTLWFAECDGFQKNEQRWKGYQKGVDGEPVVQEWKITFISDRPPAGESRAPYAHYGGK